MRKSIVGNIPHKDFLKAMNIVYGYEPIPKPRKKYERKKIHNDMREKILERDVIWRLQMEGYIVAKSGEQATYNSHKILKGMSDLMVFIPKHGVIFMELKTASGTQRESQRDFELICKQCNLTYCVVRSKEEALDECKRFISAR